MTHTEVPLPVSLPEHVRRYVEADIVTGALAPATRVTEEHLAARYSVSRTPVREAMRLLENQGLLVRRKGSGVFVAAQTTREEVEVVYQVRQSVESYLTEQAARVMTDRTIERLQQVHDEFHAELKRRGPSDIARLVSLDSQFHWAIYDSSGSDLTRVVTSYWGRLQRELAKRVYESSPPVMYADQHAAILAALRENDVAAARERMANHLKSSSDAILATYDEVAEPARRRRKQ